MYFLSAVLPSCSSISPRRVSHFLWPNLSASKALARSGLPYAPVPPRARTVSRKIFAVAGSLRLHRLLKRLTEMPLANALWGGNEKLPALRSEWEEANRPGPDTRDDRPRAVTREYRDHLLDLTRRLFERSLSSSDGTLRPNLHFRLGKMESDLGNLSGAREHFQDALRMSQRHTMAQIRHEHSVRARHALAVLCWRERAYEDALTLIQKAEEEQERVGGRWVDDISQQRGRLERIIASQKTER